MIKRYKKNTAKWQASTVTIKSFIAPWEMATTMRFCIRTQILWHLMLKQPQQMRHLLTRSNWPQKGKRERGKQSNWIILRARTVVTQRKSFRLSSFKRSSREPMGRPILHMASSSSTQVYTMKDYLTTIWATININKMMA